MTWTELAPGVQVATESIRWQFARSGGPGGQNVNKLNTKAELWVPVGAVAGMGIEAIQRLRALAGHHLTAADELHFSAAATRSQATNRQEALNRLRHLVSRAMIKPKPRKSTRPSRGARQRRLEAKRRRSQTKCQRRDGGEW